MATSPMSDVLRQFRRAVLVRDAGLTDGQLLESFISRRDEPAIEALIRRHGPMVWGVCRRVLRNAHDAEDAFQATFLVLVRKAPSIVPREIVANWLYGVAHRTALNARAAAARRRVRERQMTEMPEPAVGGPGLGPDWQDLLDQELSRLPAKYRAVVVLCDLEGKTRKEAAGELGCPEGTVASRLTRARTILARRLARRGLALSAGGLAAALSQQACVPASVVASTINSAICLATGGVAAGMISARVAALAGGAMKTMLRNRLEAMVVMVGALIVLGLGLGLSAYPGVAQQPGKEQKEPVQRAADGPPVKEADKMPQKKSARYCWLVFGPKGKVRALVRLAGDEVSIDRNGDGKFGKGERFKSEKDVKDVVIAGPDRKTSYAITQVHVLHTTPPEKFLEVRVRVRGERNYPQSCLVQMASGRKGAPEAHFDGALTVAPKRWRIVNRASHLAENELVNVGPLLPQFLKRLAGKTIITETVLPRSLKSGEPTVLEVVVVTEGEGSFVAVCSPDNKERTTSPFAKGTHPVADVEFPAKKPGDPPIRKRYALDQFCCDGCFRGPVRVPKEAGPGNARVTFSLAGWKGAKVAPSTVEVPVR
jgi:RNA polymerase sigma factor (sigma-70 family)